jgi:hypothetical protein
MVLDLMIGQLDFGSCLWHARCSDWDRTVAGLRSYACGRGWEQVDTGYDRAATFDHPFLVLIDLDATSPSSYPLQFLVITSVWNLESRMTVLPFMCLGDVQLPVVLIYFVLIRFWVVIHLASSK